MLKCFFLTLYLPDMFTSTLKVYKKIVSSYSLRFIRTVFYKLLSDLSEKFWEMVDQAGFVRRVFQLIVYVLLYVYLCEDQVPF